MIISKLLKSFYFSPTCKLNHLSVLYRFSNLNNKDTLSNATKSMPNTKSSSLQNYLSSQTSINILLNKGINALFPIQTKTYEHIYGGRDLIAGDKTGSGKTLAFTLPVLQKFRKDNVFQDQKQKGIKFVILSPTRELAVQIGNQINSLKHQINQFRVLTVFGGVAVSQNMRQLTKNPDILVGTPGRIIDLIQRGLLDLKNVKVTCIDQADHMFDIGFKYDVDTILSQLRKKSQNNIQLLCFSATLNQDVQDLTRKFMNENKVMIKNKHNQNTPTTIQHFHTMCQGKRNKILAIRYFIKNMSNDGRVIIFTKTKMQADQLGQEIGLRNSVIHGDISQERRLSRLNKFRQGAIKILIASDVAARGLDIPNVQLIINYSMPQNIQAYIHRSGRTGRAGKKGVCVTLSQDNSTSDRILNALDRKLNKPIQYLRIDKQKLEQTQEQFQKMTEEQKNVQRSQNQRQPELRSQRQPRKWQEDPNQQYSPTEVVLFDKKNLITKMYIEQHLQQYKIEYKQVKQRISKTSDTKFYIVVCSDPQNAQKCLQQGVSFLGRSYYFNKSKLFKGNSQRSGENRYGGDRNNYSNNRNNRGTEDRRDNDNTQKFAKTNINRNRGQYRDRDNESGNGYGNRSRPRNEDRRQNQQLY